MANAVFDSFRYDNSTNAIDLDTDTFKMMLVTSSYTPNVATHTKRSDVSNEVAGGGYGAGGSVLAGVTVVNDTTNHRTRFASNNVKWTGVTVTARGAVIYKSRGGAASADELVVYLDFGSDKSIIGGDFEVICPASGWTYQG